jgi:hypothetical protein
MSSNGEADKAGWSWLPHRMPGVSRLIAEKRQAWGAAHVALCWKRGVMQCEPGWFYAREGALGVGVPGPEWEAEFRMLCEGAGISMSRPVVWMRTPEAITQEGADAEK